MKNEKKEVEKKVENEKNEIAVSETFCIPCLPAEKANSGSPEMIDTMSFFPTFQIFHPILLTRENGKAWHACIKENGSYSFILKPYFLSHLYTRESVRVLGSDKKYRTALEGTEQAKRIEELVESEKGFTSLLWVSDGNTSTFATMMLYATGKSYWRNILISAKAEEEKKVYINLIDHAENLYKNQKTGNSFLKAWKEKQWEQRSLTKEDKDDIVKLAEIYRDEIINFVK